MLPIKQVPNLINRVIALSPDELHIALMRAHDRFLECEEQGRVPIGLGETQYFLGWLLNHTTASTE